MVRWSSSEGAPSNPNPADVINLSLGSISTTCSHAYRDAIAEASRKGAIVVAAAGNYNRDTKHFQPANCPNVITVAANNRSGVLASYSNYGDTVDILAPGGELSPNSDGVLSLVHPSAGDNGYAYNSGTSMAAPHVSGVVALMASQRSSLAYEPVVEVLSVTARHTDGQCPQGRRCGDAGLLDAARAIKDWPFMPFSFDLEPLSESTVSPTWGSAPAATYYELQYRSQNSSSWSVAYSGPAQGTVIRSLSPGYYYFRVRGCAAGYCGAYWRPKKTQVPDTQPITASGAGVYNLGGIGNYVTASVAWMRGNRTLASLDVECSREFGDPVLVVDYTLPSGVTVIREIEQATYAELKLEYENVSVRLVFNL